MRNLYKSTTGETLIEVLLYVVLTVTLLAGISSMYIMTIESRAKNQTILEVENQGASAMRQIAQTIRNADTINSPTAGNTSSTLSVNVINVVNNPTVFSISGNTLYMQEAANPQIALTNSQVTVSNLNFVNLSRASTPGMIRISFTLTYVNSTGKAAYDYSKTFYTTASLR